MPIRVLFTATILLGSFLLFLVQPMIGRMVLPRLGGAPAVWNTAMLFFQAALLGGYLYAHRVARLRSYPQSATHAILFLLASLTLPISLVSLDIPVTANPAPWLLLLLGLSVGPVFLMVSAQAPLMQAWFARVGTGDPYPLYAASNAGSLAALLAYPLLIEPNLTLGQQSWTWSAGYILLALLVTLCAWRTRAARLQVAETRAASWRQRLRWVAWAAIPSGLMISTTTHLTTDIMAMPLLWVIPLALYLVTFIIAFAPGTQRFVEHAQAIAPLVLLLLGAYVFLANGSVAFLMAAADLVLFFVVALALHGALAQGRPEPAQLTDFYLWVSVGGALGGLFCGLIAPLVFDWGYEHPILLVAAALLLPAAPLTRRLGLLWERRVTGRMLHWVVPPLALLASIWAGEQFFRGGGGEADLVVAALAGLGIAAVAAIGRPLMFGLFFALLMLALGGWAKLDVSTIPGARERSFFGTYEVGLSQSRRARELMHGTTLHGTQSLNPALATHPMSYYAPDSGVGRVLSAMPPGSHVGFVGLGTATLACYAKPGQRWTAYEIDPTIVSIARDPDRFSYIQRCKPDLRIVVGDARRTLAAEPAAALDALAIDAFSSDAIPMHLLTREAFAVYARALKPDGVLLVHISNRHLDLQPVVAAAAKAGGWAARLRDYRPTADQLADLDLSRSLWIALARDEATLTRALARQDALAAAFDPEPGTEGWTAVASRPGFRAWTDDYASVIPILKL